ncbi:hypothetical protein HK100_010974 [Physocladia obscura]|uniref:Uncharacterized protein n=1 Tax=Physocladia obscura TaxID=109957 RepID=A0AAD5XHZ2_9FUNG|nr:hypothetical protein HK100_010974 [Physocladia obscura]
MKTIFAPSIILVLMKITNIKSLRKDMKPQQLFENLKDLHHEFTHIIVNYPAASISKGKFCRDSETSDTLIFEIKSSKELATSIALRKRERERERER